MHLYQMWPDKLEIYFFIYFSVFIESRLMGLSLFPVFPYQDFFREQIMKKKKDHSYRVFKKVARFAQKAPYGEEFSNGPKPITVWCSNDYLGMSSHPAVKAAVV